MKEILTALALAYEPQVIPTTPDLMKAIINFQGSSIAVCKKENTPEEECITKASEKALEMRRKVDQVFEKNFADRLVSCQQEGATQGFQRMTQENVYKLTLKLA